MYVRKTDSYLVVRSIARYAHASGAVGAFVPVFDAALEVGAVGREGVAGRFGAGVGGTLLYLVGTGRKGGREHKEEEEADKEGRLAVCIICLMTTFSFHAGMEFYGLFRKVK